MQFTGTMTCIDMHTAGEPARIVTSGFPNIPGASLVEKRDHLQRHMDHIRRRVMLEPRGHDNMFGAFLFYPLTDGADFSVIFMDAGGYLNMCGHNSIAIATAAVEMGMVHPTPDASQMPLVLDTPAGRVLTDVHLEWNKGVCEVHHVAVKNVPSFLYMQDIVVELPHPYGKVTVDISFGGSFFALIDAAQLQLTVDKGHLSTLQHVGGLLRDTLNRNVSVQHPQLPHINRIDCVEIYDPPTNPAASCKNVVIFGNSQVDRSPCGTGTCAKMALLYAKGKLKVGDTFVHESISGTLFHGKLLNQVSMPGVKYPAVISEISGSAYITGFNTLLFAPRDPFRDGFTLSV
ncbi:proline racemase [Trypanosoma vivax]|uniref:Proline racemase n=2 Tax=Trypanosoma vivax TaxID=5699 RepID=G0TYJ6_TRYVY|nr:proline racemase [Trypanosoma vivax]KAG8346945.1 proline racemase [Trypanosoma vivax]CCC49043.1 conserved hypothetical protein [Trypanosoma vivax Y486]